MTTGGAGLHPLRLGRIYTKIYALTTMGDMAGRMG